MKYANQLMRGYESTRLVHYDDMTEDFENTYAYDDLPNLEVHGVLKACQYVNGRLMQTYSKQENHVGVIAATRLGKTTSYVIPTILSFAHQKIKRSMVISDPKGELYRSVSETLRKEGYKVKLFNFRDFMHSECWNPLTRIYRLYVRAYNLEYEVDAVEGAPEQYVFMGERFDGYDTVMRAVDQQKKLMMEDVNNEVDNVAISMISTQKASDPYWEDSARDLLRAGIWAMLEDIYPDYEHEDREITPITEETFSFRTLLSVLDSMRDNDGRTYEDGGYFKDRRTAKNSKAYMLVKNCILENAPNTRKCVVSTFNTKMSVYKSG